MARAHLVRKLFRAFVEGIIVERIERNRFRLTIRGVAKPTDPFRRALCFCKFSRMQQSKVVLGVLKIAFR